MPILQINGESKLYPDGTTYLEIADEYQQYYEDPIILVRYRNNLRELFKTVTGDGELEFVTVTEKAGRKTYRRSVSFLMNAAAYFLYPKVDLHIQRSLGQGYYCELFEGDCLVKVDKNILKTLKEKMQELVARDLPIRKQNMNTEEAIRLCQEHGLKDKVDILTFRRNSRVNLYDLNGYKDYYYGYMVPSTGYLQQFDLFPYQKGFMLMFPDRDQSKVADFLPMDKMFNTLYSSIEWGRSMGIRTVGDLNRVITSGNILETILVQESWMEQQIGQIAGMIASDSRRKFIMVAGPSSSGKTTFSYRLSVQLRAHGLHPHPVSLDDFYVNRVDTPVDEDGNYDYECLEAIDVELFNKCMTELLSGREVCMPIYNFKTGKREFHEKPLKLNADDVLVIEGIHGLNERLSYMLPKENKFKIYISALTQLNIDSNNPLSTTDGRLIRRIVRDNRTRNTGAKETIARWDSVRRGEEKNIFPFQEDADVMFNSALIYEMAVLKVYAEPLLFAIDHMSPEYEEAKRLLKLLEYFVAIPAEEIGHNSLLREFVGGGCFNV